MPFKETGAKPTLANLNQLETAILMEKYILILGMIHYGTDQQKEQAKKELSTLDDTFYLYVNAAAMELANRRLQWTEEELNALERVKF